MVTFQRQCLLLATGCLPSTSSEILNLMCNILPIDLYLKVKTSESMIMFSSKTSPLNSLYCTWKNSKATEKYISSFSKMFSSIRQILKSRSTPQCESIPIWDKCEPTFLDHNIIIEPRNDKEQKIQVVNNLLKDNNFYYIVCTDGSTIKNESKQLGKTGSVAVIYGRVRQLVVIF